MTWRPHFTKLCLESPVTEVDGIARIDKSHPAYEAWQQLVYHASKPTKNEIQLQTCLVNLARLLFAGPRYRPPEGSRDALIDWCQKLRARGQSVSEFTGAGVVEAEIGGDLLQLHTLDGRVYKQCAAYLAETAVLDRYRQLVRQQDDSDTPGGSGKRPLGIDRPSEEKQNPPAKRSRASDSGQAGPFADTEHDPSKSRRSSRQTGAGTRLPDVWILASCYLLAELSSLDRQLKQGVAIYRAASALFEVKKYTLTKKPTKDAIAKVCQGIAQMVMYLCASNDICGTFVAACLVNSKFSRACMLSVTELKTEDDGENAELSTTDAPPKVYEIALETHGDLSATLRSKSISLSTLLGDGELEGLSAKDRILLLAHDLIEGYDEKGNPLVEDDGLDDIALSADSCARMWDLLRMAVDLICDLPWNTPISRFSPTSTLFQDYAETLRQSRVENVPVTRNHDLTWAEMSRLCAVRRGEDYVSRLFPRHSSDSQHYFEFEIKEETDDGASATTPSRLDRPTTSSSDSMLSHRRLLVVQRGDVSKTRHDTTRVEHSTEQAEDRPRQNLRPPSARDSLGESSSSASRRLVTPQTAKDVRLSSTIAKLATKQAVVDLEQALDSSPRQHVDTAEQLDAPASRLDPAPILVVHPPDPTANRHSAKHDNIMSWRESCSPLSEDAHQYAGPAVWPQLAEPQIRLLLVSPIEMDRLLELKAPAPNATRS